jgi:hypothetical protein
MAAMGWGTRCHNRATASAIRPSCLSARRISVALLARSIWYSWLGHHRVARSSAWISGSSWSEWVNESRGGGRLGSSLRWRGRARKGSVRTRCVTTKTSNRRPASCATAAAAVPGPGELRPGTHPSRDRARLARANGCGRLAIRRRIPHAPALKCGHARSEWDINDPPER